MRSFIWQGLILTLSLLFSVVVYAGSAQNLELKELSQVQNNLDVQKEWIKYRYDESVSNCYSHFWMQRCMNNARTQYLKETKEVRDQEIPLHDRQRQVNETIKDERDQLRISEYKDPKKTKERAENRSAFEEKQRLRQERIQELEERRKDAPARADENRKSSPLD
jgi:hypothetical protein